MQLLRLPDCSLDGVTFHSSISCQHENSKQNSKIEILAGKQNKKVKILVHLYATSVCTLSTLSLVPGCLQNHHHSGQESLSRMGAATGLSNSTYWKATNKLKKQ